MPAVVAAMALATAAGPAAAHVKWFSRDADCAMPPLSPLQAMSSQPFLLLGALSFVVMLLATRIDALLSRPGHRLWGIVVRCDDGCSPHAMALLRWALAAFFIVSPLYFGDAPVLLTPELHARQAWVVPLQFGIALALMWRRGAWLGSAGIAVLYATAVAEYGWFHLLDYPVFLGAAAAVAIDSLGGKRSDALAVLRVSAGITLMWAGAEKWLYPWWSDGVLDGPLSDARGAMSKEFFMAAAGWVEFCCAYALVFGRLGTQVAAAVLLVPFIGAVPIFGVLDAVGHAPIVVVLVILALTRSRMPAWAQRRDLSPLPWGRPMSCLLSAVAMLGLYWGLQALAYRSGRIPVQMWLPSCLLLVPLALWCLPPRLRTAAAA